MPSVVIAQGVAKSYGKTEALRNVSFHLPEDTVAGLLGPNGSGKTTTIKILLGLLRKDKGEVEVFGCDPWLEEAEVRRRVGAVHEKPLYPLDERVSRLLRHTVRMKGAPQNEVGRLLHLTGLSEYADMKVRALSRGYLQRLGIAIALVGDPELLLLDEPTANLDPSARKDILRLIKTLQEELGATIMVSSHIVPELQEVCDYAVFIQEGIVLDYGSMDELARKYSVSAHYFITAKNVRLLASELVKEEFVESVELGDGYLTLRVKGGAYTAAEVTIAKLAEKGLVENYELRTASLGELYSKVIAQ
ncbi:MAG: ABC transporter ATP-binding protein [Thermofilaceae archaeon]